MKSQHFYHEELGNGVTLIGERIDSVSSAALSLLVPSGVARDKEGEVGCSTVLVEMMQRGAGPYDSKELSDAYESIGVHRSQSAGIEVSAFSAAMLAEHLNRALELFATVLLEPRLPSDEFENSRELALQDLNALEDEPGSKVMSLLAERFYPSPFGRSPLGTKQGLSDLSMDSLQRQYKEEFRNQGVIISVAGKFDWDSVRKSVSKAFSSWSGKTTPLHVPPLPSERVVWHEQKESAQVQIALACPSVSFGHPDYYTCKVGLAVLSGGMAGRLFVEVREKRGLVYRVGASHSAARGRAAVFASAGTTPQNAQETLDVMCHELLRLREGVSHEELERARVEMKSALLLQSESSSARASALVNDWWNIGRIRTLEEIRAGIESVSEKDIERHFTEFSLRPTTLVTLGSQAVELQETEAV